MWNKEEKYLLLRMVLDLSTDVSPRSFAKQMADDPGFETDSAQEIAAIGERLYDKLLAVFEKENDGDKRKRTAPDDETVA